MDTVPDLPTWRILPGADGQFSWSPAHEDAQSRLVRPRRVPIPRGGQPALPRIPSVADLLLQESPKLLGGGGGGEGSVPMFRTGSGRSVSVRRSSILKAASVLGEPDKSERGHGVAFSEIGAGDEGLPMFCTGSGKSVTVRKSSLNKAASVLEGDITEKEKIFGHGEVSAPMFQTGLGKPIGVKQSSVMKALSVLQEEKNPEKDLMKKHDQGVGISFSSSLLQTGSGKTVNISSDGVRRSTALLGLDENHVHVEYMMDQTGNFIANGKENLCHLAGFSRNPGTAGMCFVDPVGVRPVHRNCFSCLNDVHASKTLIEKNAPQSFLDVHTSASMTPPIRFHTAGGRSLSISHDALQRAKSLLGELDSGIVQNGSTANYLVSSVSKENLCESSWNKENFHHLDRDSGMSINMLRMPLRGSLTTPKLSVAATETTVFQENEGGKNDFATENIHKSNRTLFMQNIPRNNIFATHKLVKNLRTEPGGTLLGKPLVDITNKISAVVTTQMDFSGEKKRHRRTRSISPFKRPRSSRFSTPLRENISFLATGQSALSISRDCYQKIKVSTRYPFQQSRKTILEFFEGPPNDHDSSEHLSDQVRYMNADRAAAYRFKMSCGLEGIGADDLQHMLVQSGASSLKATKEWVQNHYKWVVWKLACLERGYPKQARGNYLTVANVLEELKYRYEREVNHGHRSAVKKILDGDASPASMVVLCISAIHPLPNNKICEVDNPTTEFEDVDNLNCNEHKCNHAMKIELTDGWYSLDATLDGALSKHLVAGKLFVGQKLRIWGAALCGWVGPVSPLEACKTVSLRLHINGTYRVHWAERLGFCKGFRFPLAYRCIKGAGGQAPKTLIGITRIYPILYKERFPDGGSIVRSERMENRMLQVFNQRRFLIAEDIMSEQDKVFNENDNDSEEGAKIFKILEKSAEPELLMADMTSEQLISFSNYQAKQEVIKQNNIQKKIEKALEDAGLSFRDVSPFMRVRVVGLTHKGSSTKGSTGQGLITLWNPTEKQKVDLVEGQIYSVSGLVPLNGGSDIIYLQARGPTSIWKPLSPIETKKFEPFFNSRRSVLLSTLGEVPLASEFDIAAIVLYVGDAFIAGRQKKQWVFMTDGSQSGSELWQERTHNSLLAVSFCIPITDNDLSALVSPTLSGSTVCFYNLVKRACDQVNHLWVAEATENSTYSLSDTLSSNSHLKEAAKDVTNWANGSFSTLQKFREKVLYIVDGCGG